MKNLAQPGFFSGPPNVLSIRNRKTMFLRLSTSFLGAVRSPLQWPDSVTCVGNVCNFEQTEPHRHIFHVVYPTFPNNLDQNKKFFLEGHRCHPTAL